jgi:hypothetical protein
MRSYCDLRFWVVSSMAFLMIIEWVDEWQDSSLSSSASTLQSDITLRSVRVKLSPPPSCLHSCHKAQKVDRCSQVTFRHSSRGTIQSRMERVHPAFVGFTRYICRVLSWFVSTVYSWSKGHVTNVIS